jgi:serine kinase of HPr protein (carbohydrate metabolism regulator)
LGAASQSAVNEASVSLHASAVVFGEAGILIRGPSGAGKSSLAFGLLAVAAQTGHFGRLLGDDRIELDCSSARLIARGHPSILGMIELRHQGIIHIPHEAAVVVRLIVDLVSAEELMRYPDPPERQAELCGVKLPRLALPSGRSSYDCALSVMARLQQTETI